MSLYWEFLAQQSQIASLRETGRILNRMAGRERKRLSARMEEDIGALGLVLMGLTGLLIEKGVVTRDELVEHLRRVDALDGAADGKVTADQVRVALGLVPPDPGPPPAPVPTGKRR